jgi:CheY-like chemotaxis protein
MADVLVVDDAPDVGAVTAAVLARLGHRVRLVESGAAALAELERCPARLLVLDLDMPGMHGWEVLRRVRADPKLARMRVVVYSASADADAHPAGATPDRVIRKGAPIPEVVRTFEQLV